MPEETQQPAREYRWTKIWAVQTRATDDVIPGGTINVTTHSGTSRQRVLSVTECHNRNDEPYKVLLVQEVK
jgi:hypothetical protein